MIDRVFNRFETFPNGSRHRGPGLGLSIVKAMVELHKGRVLIDTAPNEGTTVTCIFPIDPAALASDPTNRVARAGEAAIGPIAGHDGPRQRPKTSRRSGCRKRRTKPPR